MLRYSTAEDVMQLAPKLSEMDVREAEVIAGLSPLEALSVGIFQSDPCMSTVTAEGQLLGMCGVVPAPHRFGGIAWFMSSPEIAAHRRELLTEAREWVEEQVKQYSFLFNYILSDNQPHRLLVRHLGFSEIKETEINGHQAICIERTL